ncbi:DM13 domain-containing protein [Amycolatopsis nigrescens]|uniref:DM13 domain-containing protein n=1 Tax=Amycolatopsis nigrescens TaxID=381445 RepID=UPI00036C34FF|nr:DM13 domain-containing protein [Amycolatopsis nigrescens]
MRGLLRRKTTWAVLGVAVVAGAIALALFEPWRLFTRSTVDEALPAVSAVVAESPAVPAAPSSTANPGPSELAKGGFVSQEHPTSGTARVLDLGGGERVLRLEDFASSDGPDLHVWLTDATASGEWGKYDDGRAVRLGELKATDGNQNYRIPAEADLAGLRSVVIWCDRFNVAFGSAPLDL